MRSIANWRGIGRTDAGQDAGWIAADGRDGRVQVERRPGRRILQRRRRQADQPLRWWPPCGRRGSPRYENQYMKNTNASTALDCRVSFRLFCFSFVASRLPRVIRLATDQRRKRDGWRDGVLIDETCHRTRTTKGRTASSLRRRWGTASSDCAVRGGAACGACAAEDGGWLDGKRGTETTNTSRRSGWGSWAGGSLAGQFAVETAERHGEGLHGAHRVAKVHGEHVLGHAAELHDDVVAWKRRETPAGGCILCCLLSQKFSSIPNSISGLARPT